MTAPMVAVAKLVAAAPSAKVAAGALAVTDAYWGFVTFAQADSSGLSAETLVPAGLTTMVTGALIWVMRRVASGELVHRDPQKATEALAAALSESAAAVSAVASAVEKLSVENKTLVEDSKRREDRLFQLLASGEIKAKP